MPHATHFLSRLERLTPSQVDRALTLYRAPELLQALAATVETHLGERIALALEDGHQPPHLVITTTGDCITCLGPRMSTGPWPIVAFDVVESVLTRHRHQTLADRLVGEAGRGFTLLSKLVEPGQVSREVLLGVAAYYQPVSEEMHQLLRHAVMAAQHVTDLAADGHLSPVILELLWARTTAVGHAAVLASLGRAPSLTSEAVDDVLEVAIRSGHLATVARGLWASMQQGQARWASSIKQLGRITSFNGLVRCALEVTVHALANQSLRNATRRALAETSALLTGGTCLAAPAVCSMLLAVLDSPDVHRQLFSIASTQLCVVLGERAPSTSAFHFACGDAVPRSLLGAGLVLLPQTIHESTGWTTLMTALPFIAAAEAHELYLPDDALRAWGMARYRPKVAEHLARTVRAHRTRPQPRVNEAPRSSRNAPCACGSGKKRKRCCLSTSADAPASVGA